MFRHVMDHRLMLSRVKLLTDLRRAFCLHYLSRFVVLSFFAAKIRFVNLTISELRNPVAKRNINSRELGTIKF